MFLSFSILITVVYGFNMDVIRQRYDTVKGNIQFVPSYTAPFRIPTNEERMREAAVQDFLKKLVPQIPKDPCHVSEVECLETEGCAWCPWPGACLASELTDLLPTQRECVEGGIPFLLEELTSEPVLLCQIPGTVSQFNECWVVNGEN
jgi:hypothetical protein